MTALTNLKSQRDQSHNLTLYKEIKINVSENIINNISLYASPAFLLLKSPKKYHKHKISAHIFLFFIKDEIRHMRELLSIKMWATLPKTASVFFFPQ